MSIFNVAMLLSSLSAATLAGTLGASSLAFGPGTSPAPHRKGGLCSALECTDAQREQIQSIRKQLRANLKPQRQAIKGIHRDLAAEYAKANPDDRAMKRLMKSLSTRKDTVSEMHQAALMETHAVLTPQQRTELSRRVARRGPAAALRKRGGTHKKARKGHKGGKKATKHQPGRTRKTAHKPHGRAER